VESSICFCSTSSSFMGRLFVQSALPFDQSKSMMLQLAVVAGLV
jgi:hypothetical protein